MERDIDLIREILLNIEKNPEMDGTREFMYLEPEELGIVGHSVEQLAYHIKLLIQGNFVQGAVTMAFPMHIMSCLTWAGHEFLDNIRDPGVWGRTKKRLEGLPSVSISLMAQIAVAEAKKHLGLR